MSYDLIADRFLIDRQPLGREKPYIDRLLHGLPTGAHILDLGCGTGRPIAEYLVASGFAVTGVDSSLSMLAHAAQIVPQARLIHGDMVTIQLPAASFDAVIVWDSLFHVDRCHHAKMYSRMASWLRPHGRLLLSTGGTGDPGFTAGMFGHEFFYSSYTPNEARQLLENTGFRTLAFEIDDPSSKGHVAVVAELDSAFGS